MFRTLFSRRLAGLIVPLILLTDCSAGPSDRSTVPAWVPDYPGAETLLVSSAETEEGWRGTAMASLDVPLDEAFEFYRSELRALGFRLRLAPVESNVAGIAQVSGFSNDETRGITVTVSPDAASSQVVINFTQAD